MEHTSPHERLPRKGLLLLAALALGWGVNWPIMKIVLTEVPPLYFRAVSLLLPFQRIVNIIYGINGYVGILLILFMIVKTARNMRKPA